MPAISCEVKKCFYNKDGGCRLEGIKVDGENAVIASETMCESYTDAKQAGTADCACESCACDDAEIECSAEKCRHNEHGYCEASSINIGCSSSCCAAETKCETFEE